MSDFRDFVKAAASVVPSKRQLDWFETNFYAFVHICPNTFTGLEWGLGNEDPACFNPTELDCDQWVEAIKSAGMKGAVITAKHHDGFCLWDTKYTDHNIMNSPYGKDLVKEFADACRRGGIKFGFYLSPWDRNSKLYGTEAYNEYYRNQLIELLTGYGEVFHVWFDGSCGEGPEGKKQEYTYREYFDLIRKYQPNATIFNDHGPDVRWCGNESASTRHAEWAVVPSELCYYAEVQTPPSPIAGDLTHMENCDPEIGTLTNSMYSKGLVFCGAEVDVSIRKGWFWHPEEEPHSLEKLFDMYLRTVGGNACLNLNVPPDNRGLIDERDVKRLKELGDKIKAEFAHDHAEGCEIKRVETRSESQSVFELELPKATHIRYIELREDLTKGQRIEDFRIHFYDEKGEKLQEYIVYYGTTVGNRKICAICRDMWDGLISKKIRITITSARDEVHFKSIRIF
ncbi:MAG: alpha-fucosidase [Ruminococcaceae bacterium]|nr:alpha-fucosidase [Oscillospiraceae bacterium]